MSRTCRLLNLRSRLLRFIFSSRRRHTRWPRDWSSDVCSSDLSVTAADYQSAAAQDDEATDYTVHMSPLNIRGHRAERSEERRVGKECRYRWSRYAWKNK